MKPVTPVLKGLEQYEIILAKDQPQYEPLPALYTEGEEKRVITRWRFSDEEREEISKGADLILEQLTFGYPFQPVALGVQLIEYRDYHHQYTDVGQTLNEELE